MTSSYFMTFAFVQPSECFVTSLSIVIFCRSRKPCFALCVRTFSVELLMLIAPSRGSLESRIAVDYSFATMKLFSFASSVTCSIYTEWISFEGMGLPGGVLWIRKKLATDLLNEIDY